MPELKLVPPEFYSPGDERAFFGWLNNVPCVTKVTGIGQEIILSINANSLPDQDLRELIALLMRYSTDLSPLQQFLTDKNSYWFKDNAEAYWHRSVFGG